MNKLLSNVLFYSTAIAVGASIGTCIAWYNRTTSPQTEEIETQVEELKTEEPDLVEEKPAKNEEKSWEKPANFESKTVPKTETVNPQTTTTPPIPKTETVNSNEFSIYDYGDYEETILGTCPSERDQSNSWERGSRMAALRTEIDRSPWTRLTLNQLIESWWDGYRQGKWTGKHMMASLNHIEGFDDNYSNSLVAMYIDFDGFFVTWDNSWQDGKSMNVSTEQGNYLNKVQSDGTLYLRSLESRYNAKCPND